MSAPQSQPRQKENQVPRFEVNIASSLALDMEEVKGNRVTLQTLQPSAKVKGLVGSHGQVVLLGKDGKIGIRSTKTQTGPGKIQVFEDESGGIQPKTKQVKMQDKGVQTDSPEEQEVNTMTTEAVSVDYYSTLAERRRLALAEALVENEQLHLEVDTLKSEIDALKNENSMLKPMAEEAEYLAGVLKDLVGTGEEEVASSH